MNQSFRQFHSQQARTLSNDNQNGDSQQDSGDAFAPAAADARRPNLQPGESLVANGPPPESGEYNVFNRVANNIADLRSRQMPRIPAVSLPSGPNLRGLTSSVSNVASLQGIGSINTALSQGFGKILMAPGKLVEIITRRLPHWRSLLYSLRFLSSSANYANSRDMESFGQLLITTSNESSEQYYSLDLVENMKLKITLKEINLFSAPKKKKPRGDNYSELNDDEDDDEYKTYSVVIGWQQKVFSSRELVLYSKLTEPPTALDRMYTDEVKSLIDGIPQQERNSEKYATYLQEKPRLIRQAVSAPVEVDQPPADGDAPKKKKKKKGKKKRTKRRKKRADGEGAEGDENADAQEEQDEDAEQDEEEQDNEDDGAAADQPPQQVATKFVLQKQKLEQFSDMLHHPLFTYVDSDPFETDTLQQPLYSSSSHVPRMKRHSDDSTYKSPSERPRQMYIMASFANEQGSNKENEAAGTKWEGFEYALCIITSLPDGSLIMRPGLSEVIKEDDDDELNKLPQLRFSKKIQRTKAPRRYVFRTKDGRVYEYTITLYNEYPKDKHIESVRKKLLQQMYDRSVLMKKNLIGNDFALPLIGARRVVINGEISSATGFDVSSLYIRYFVDLPPQWEQEPVATNSPNQLESQIHPLVAATQTARPRRIFNEDTGMNEDVTHFGFPFQFSFLAQQTHPAPRIYFQAASQDLWGRVRTEGYGYLQLPSQAAMQTHSIQTWKIRGTLRQELRSYFVGGSPVLSDVSAAGIPSEFREAFLNKSGIPSTPSGTIEVKVHILVQR